MVNMNGFTREDLDEVYKTPKNWELMVALAMTEKDAQRYNYLNKEENYGRRYE